MSENQEIKIIETIKLLIKEGQDITPFTVSRRMGYRLSGRISTSLKSLEAQGRIKRIYHTANECEIKLLEDSAP